MKFLRPLLPLLLLCLGTSLLSAEDFNPQTYKRSSLCIILVSHDKGTYSEEIKEEFLKMDTPIRYNGFNVDTRVFVVGAGDVNRKDIDQMLLESGIAKQLVAQWFDYDPDHNLMDMNMIHGRGGYSATYSQFRKAQSMERGMAMLTDSGIDLINNTFVLVCDMDYYDKEKSAQAASTALAIGSVALSILGAASNDQTTRDLARAGSVAAAAGAIVASDLGGFSVKMHAHLYKLRWNGNVQDKFFGEYWVDSQMSDDERAQRAQAFAQDSETFTFDYIGDYKEKTGKTVFKSANDLHEVIRTVCNNTLEAGVTRLASTFEVFRPKSSFYCNGDDVYSYIGTKEGITSKSKYEVVAVSQESPSKYTYKRMADFRPGEIWDNSSFNFATDSLGSIKGTQFVRKSGYGVELENMGYTLREYTTKPVSVFLQFNMTINDQLSYGASLAVAGTFGGYARFCTGSTSSYNNFTVAGGLTYRCLPWLYAYAGSGYGQYYRTYSGSNYGGGGAMLDLGLMFRARWFVVSAGYTATFVPNWTQNAFTFGVGFAIGKYR